MQKSLSTLDLPSTIRWVLRNEIVVRYRKPILAGPASQDGAGLIEKVFEEGRAKGLVEIYVLGVSANSVLATVWYPKLDTDEVQGWDRGFKLSLSDPLPRARVLPWALWAVVRRTPLYRRYQKNAHFIGTREWAAM